MKKVTFALIVAATGCIAAGAGFWAGQFSGNGGSAAAGRATQGSHDGHASLVANGSALAQGAKKEREVLFYRNPMGLPDTSPVPKKDSMGMDYIPVYADDETDSGAASFSTGQVRIDASKIQAMGVRTEPVRREILDRIVSAAGRVEADERRLHVISAKFEGYVERLRVNATGESVGRGQVLFEAYSPELVSAQREYLIARQGFASLTDSARADQVGEGMRLLADSGLARLRYWDVSEAHLSALARSGQVLRTLPFRSPASGVVTEKRVVEGMRFQPGEVLYQIADLSSVWVLADIFEQDLGTVRLGAKAQVVLESYPGEVFEGRVSFIAPTLQGATRTVPVRIELPNPGMRLKPGMFARVDIRMSGHAPVLSVPSSAVIDSGVRRVVLLAMGAGRFAPRVVKTGLRTGERVEILEGVQEGEEVVVAAQFLIDAESNLNAALESFDPSSKMGALPRALPAVESRGAEGHSHSGQEHGHEQGHEHKHAGH